MSGRDAHGFSHGTEVSLVICTTGREDRLTQLLARARAVVDRAGERSEVVVVDNSAAGDVALPDVAGLRVVRAGLPGLSRARTTGCIQARGDVLVFTDDDVDFPADWPHRMARPILDGELDATAAPIRLGEELASITSPLLRGWLAEANLSGGTPHLVGAGMAFRRSMLGVGLWDPALGAGVPDLAFGEETLFGLMLRDAGARIGVATDAEVVHHPDLDRADPDRWRRTALQKGLSDAYISYHWHLETMPKPRLRELRRRVRLAGHRRRSRGDTAAFEEELVLIESWARAAGFVREQGRPRAYWPRLTASVEHHRDSAPGDEPKGTPCPS